MKKEKSEMGEAGIVGGGGDRARTTVDVGDDGWIHSLSSHIHISHFVINSIPEGAQRHTHAYN